MSYIKLSPRMQTIADMADKKSIADIGCDHAFISIYLIQSGRADRVIAADVRQGPLDIARNNIDMYGLSSRIDTRISDGFDKIDVGETEQAIISGMGGELIVDILKKGRAQLEYGIGLILQPQSEPEKVRRYLLDTGYIIVDERMLIDEGKYYVVIKAVPHKSSVALDMQAVKLKDYGNKGLQDICYSQYINYSDIELLYGKLLIQRKDFVLKEYLLMQLHKNKELVDKLSDVKTDNSMKKIAELKKAVKMIEEVLHCF
ncbi:MAG: SAM-dependent methyltransferase [Lachnospiraceae bacterium]|nr:SAM-dependent methyltransferase [Lachnospiraceae bacterium]